MGSFNEKTEVIKMMEYIIAKNCSTGTYTIGKYRYPVKLRKGDKKYKTSGNSLADVTLEEISSMYYEFGAHRVDIGKALLKIMDYLEERNPSAFDDLIMWPNDEL